ncbi:MAG: hypothetical protein IPJ77_03960 [Planctomycetes bacterium]|nr:hypothetical protein [Planctomycetota bacterium]
MSLHSFLYALASIPMFAARPFLAALLTSALARFGEHVPFLADSKVIQALAHAPEWFKSWTALLILLVLAVGETLAAKNADVRAVMEDLDGWIKSGVSLLVSFALIDGETASTIKDIQRHGFGIESLWSVVCAVGTYFVALLRRGALWIVNEVDDGDDIGLQTVLNWVESTWTVSGLFFIVVFPVAAIVLSAMTALALFGVKRWHEKREEASKVPCARCGTPTLPHATQCPACKHDVAAPRAVGVFGTPKTGVCEDRERQRFDLLGRKRCPVCATRLKRQQVQQTCEACKTVTFASDAQFQGYLDALSARLPKTLVISFVLSAIPIVGVIPGVIYYRLTLISGLRGYVPPVRGCVSRVLLFFIRWILVALQPIPVIGALVIPLMCLSSYLIYKRALVGRARKDLAVATA